MPELNNSAADQRIQGSEGRCGDFSEETGGKISFSDFSRLLITRIPAKASERFGAEASGPAAIRDYQSLLSLSIVCPAAEVEEASVPLIE